MALDLGVHTTTPAGQIVASLTTTFAQYERRIIGVGTREALAVMKLEGVVLGRPRVLSLEVVKRIKQGRQTGQTLAAIADTLNDEGIPTANGGARSHRAHCAPGPARSVGPYSKTPHFEGTCGVPR